MAVVVKGKKEKDVSESGPSREKKTIADQIKELEDKIANTRYNKKTQFAIGQYKAKLARLREKASSGGKGKGSGFAVRKSGDGTVALLGFPSVGKSTLMNKLTGSNSETGAYAFTTLDVIPGLLKYKGAQIQILDVPGIVKGAASGSGRGREVLAALRSADLIIILLDVLHTNHLPVLKKELFDAGIRVNKEKPDVKIIKKSRDGISIASTLQLSKLDTDALKPVLKEFGLSNCDVVIRSDIDFDDFIDVIAGNRAYTKAITVINKIDLVDETSARALEQKLDAEVSVSGETGLNLDKLKDVIFDTLKFIRIYTKEKGKPADMGEPLIVLKGSTVEDVCNKLHKDFVKKFKSSKIWGDSAKFPGQVKMLDHVLADGDIVEITTR